MAHRSLPGALLIGRLQHLASRWISLESKYKLHQHLGDRTQFLSDCKSGKYNDVVALYRTTSIVETGPFDRELVSALPNSLKFICLNAAGYDGMDLDACAERNILISNTPGVVNNATADVAMFLMLGALRKAMIPINNVQGGRWKADTPLGKDPSGKKLGVLGMGGIGMAIRDRATAFGMEIIYHNRTKLDESLEKGATYVSFDDLLQQSDVLSLNLSASAATRHMISKTQFDRMKDGVVIINTARGSLINEQHLVDALNSGKVYSVGLDVYENEPQIHPELLNNDKAFILPHIGTTTRETKVSMEALALDNVEAAIDSGRLLNPIPECRPRPQR